MPVQLVAHHPKLLWGYGQMEQSLASSHLVGAALKDLAQLRVATLVGIGSTLVVNVASGDYQETWHEESAGNRRCQNPSTDRALVLSLRAKGLCLGSRSQIAELWLRLVCRHLSSSQNQFWNTPPAKFGCALVELCCNVNGLPSEPV
jgi:hypothetical protein